MASDSAPSVPFSQRTGLEPIPPQLKLGQVSPELRHLLYYYIRLEIDRGTAYSPYSSAVFNDKWKRVAMDLHVLFFKEPADKFPYLVDKNEQRINVFVQRADIGKLFDLVEFLVQHPGCSKELTRELTGAFVTARAAYRLFDKRYIAGIGTDEQAMAFERAIADAEAKNATAARNSSSRQGSPSAIPIGLVVCVRAFTPSRHWRCVLLQALALWGQRSRCLSNGATCMAASRRHLAPSMAIQATRKAFAMRSCSAMRPRWTRPTHCSCWVHAHRSCRICWRGARSRFPVTTIP